MFVNVKRDEAIHNYLLMLYAEGGESEKLLQLIKYDGARFDNKYALRTCITAKELRACVAIYVKMGKLEEAVKLALTVDVALAKDCTKHAEGMEQFR